MSALKLRIEAVRHAAKNRAAGYVDAVMAAAVQFNDTHIWISREDFDRIRVQFAGPCGPGCQLRRSLSWWGIRDDGSCGCDSFAAKMDAWGQGCWEHLEEIVEHLRGAAEKKGLPFLATAARILVARAIDAARREQSNGQKAEAEARASDVGRPQ
jgi:hypothetical protein